jgi:hypothetical protein
MSKEVVNILPWPGMAEIKAPITVRLNGHLYSLSDEPLKEGDWFMNTGSGGHPTPKVYRANANQIKTFGEFGPFREIKRIEASTDPNLNIKIK